MATLGCYLSHQKLRSSLLLYCVIVGWEITGIIASIKFMLTRIPIFIVFIISLLNIGASISNDMAFEQKLIVLAGEEYLLEIARSPEQRGHGLMFRDQLDERQGMLFIYPRPGDHLIWMKNTLIPLTVIWVDENNEVIGIKNLSPCERDPCPVYGVSKPSKYILELSGGDHRLEPGLRINGLTQFE